MRDGWREVRLGELFEATNNRLGEYREEPQVLSVTKYAGVVRAEDYFEKRVASANLDTYKVLEPDDWAYSTIHIDEGSIDRNRLGTTGVVSPMYTTMRFKSSVALPEYCELVLRSQAMLNTFQRRQQGSINRRRSLPWRVFSEIELPLPPLDEQRRIADLVEAVDTAVRATQTIAAKGHAVLNLVRSIPAGATSRTTALGDLVVMRSGPSWQAAEESPVPTDGAQPVLGITNTPAGSRIRLEERRYVSGLPETVQLLDESSLVMIRTNGNRRRIGNIYRATPEVEGFAVSAFQIAMRAFGSTDQDFLYWYLGSPEVQGSITAAASGSTGLGNVAVGWLKQLPIPDLETSERAQYIALCESVGAVVEGAESELTRLSELRSNLLDALLSGGHEIPESYDDVLRTG